ncbi:MAG TPA: hypothetical protein VGQ12_17010 [Candidatus Angelobacter sp.]|jgi:hypothetical protein|nr:hypothetical protein [Candidatus Angelobacter sp.]
MNQRATKTAWHLLLAGLAVYELAQSSTPFRKMLCGGCAGWHFAAAYVDFTDHDYSEST